MDRCHVRGGRWFVKHLSNFFVNVELILVLFQVCAQLPKLSVEPCCQHESTEIRYEAILYIMILFLLVYCSWLPTYSLILLFSGTDKVVLGDLVYCNEESSNEVKQVHDSEYEDIGCNDSSENNHLDEADPLPSEGTCSSVKVREYCLNHGLVLTP